MAKQSTLSERIMKFISADRGEGISINWEKLARLKQSALTSSEYRGYESIMDDLLGALEEIGIMTAYTEKGSFEIIGFMGAPMGPVGSMPSIIYNFKQRVHAEEYLPYAGILRSKSSLPAKILKIK